jgi:hypothetical protein
MRPIDHLVLPVTTLSLARSRLAGLGFTVAPDAVHPFGTGNCCVFFRNRTYLEPITLLDRAAADMAAAEGLAFVKRLKRFTERQGEGFAMVALTSVDAEADRAAFAAAGFAGGPLHRFARPATLPDGEAGEIGVVLADIGSPATQDAGFFACQHLAKDVLFQEPFLEHANGATGIVSVVAVAENPADFHMLLETATGTRELHATSLGIEAQVEGHTIAILTPDGFRARYERAAPNPRRGMLFAAFDLEVADLARASAQVGRAGRQVGSRLVVPPGPGLNAVVAFRSAANG